MLLSLSKMREHVSMVAIGERWPGLWASVLVRSMVCGGGVHEDSVSVAALLPLV